MSGVTARPPGSLLTPAEAAAIKAQTTKLTAAAFSTLVSSSGLSPGGFYNVDGQLRQALTANTFDSFSGASAAGAEALTTSTGSFTFTGSAYRFVLDNEGTWQPMVANMPGFGGARAVINWAANSDTPATWITLADAGGTTAVVQTTDNQSANVSALRQTNSSATAFGPYIYGYTGFYQGPSLITALGLQPPGVIFAACAEIKSISGSVALNIYQRNRDGNYTPTESGNGPFTCDSSSFRRFSSSFEQSCQYQAFGMRFHPSPGAISTFDVIRPHLEDVSGRKGALIPSEYVPAGATPGWRWFDTTRPTARTNPTFVASAVAMTAQKNPVNNLTVTGEVTTVAASAISGIKGLFCEPAATNLCQGWNTPLIKGWAKTSGAITGFTGRPGILAGSSTVYFEAPSGMLAVGTDIALAVTTNIVSSSTTNFVTAGFNTIDTYWIHCVTGSAVFGPLKFTSIGANSMTSTVALTTVASGSTVRILRCPASGDNIVLAQNDGTYFATTVSGSVTLPTGAWDIKGPVAVPVTAAPPQSGGYAGSDNGFDCYFSSPTCAEFGWAIASGTGTIRLVFDRQELVQSTEGLGYVSPAGLCFALVGAASGATVYDFGVTGNGTASRNTIVSMYAKRIGSGTCNVVLKSHSTPTVFTNSTWQRVSWSGASVNTDSRVNISVAANTTVYVVMMQVEQAASGATAVVSSPIITRGAAATRTATRAVRAWNGADKNNITRRITWTPAYGPLAQKQTIWALWQDANNLLELSITNTTVTWRKRRDGVNYDVTASYTPVAGTAVEFVAAISQASGVTLSIAGVAATPNTTDYAPITALTPAALEDLGSSQGATGLYGYLRNLAVA